MTTEKIISALVEKMKTEGISKKEVFELIESEIQRWEWNAESELFRRYYKNIHLYLSNNKREEGIKVCYVKNFIHALELLHNNDYGKSPSKFIKELSEKIGTSEQRIRKAMFGKYRSQLWLGLRGIVRGKGCFGYSSDEWEEMSENEKFTDIKEMEKFLYSY